MRLTLLEILEATGGGEVGGTQVGNTFATYHTDSRQVQQGGVFFALRGGAMDGHRFVGDALARGAAALIVERRTELAHGVVEVVVEDTWAALYSLAGSVLERVKPLVVAVTGSSGKTSTKEMTAAVLGVRYAVLHTAGNLNTETGVPLTILRLERDHTALVLEMGMQRAGDIRRLVGLAKPSIGIITNIGTVHMEFFPSRLELARGKSELVAGLPVSGHAVLNADDHFYPLLAEMSKAEISSFGSSAGAYRVERYRALPEGGSAFSIRGAGVRLALDGRHQALNAAAALAAGEAAGVPIESGATALESVAIEHRLQYIDVPGGYTVVDDAYNASPESMLAAFEAMQERPHRGRLLAVLGRMGELGSVAEDAHRRVGIRAGDVFDAVCVVEGEHAAALAEAAHAELVADKAAAFAWVKANAQPGDRVLIKASHSAGLDELVNELTR
jgi:UDP-N-acetylmuramoyl-tripeptide--D-alanyl-D-alanine ligase